MDEYQNKGLTKWVPLKGKELNQKRAVIGMKTGVDALYWEGVNIYK